MKTKKRRRGPLSIIAMLLTSNSGRQSFIGRSFWPSVQFQNVEDARSSLSEQGSPLVGIGIRRM
ncbi:MAG: hypothetical protein GY696_04185 [Gammaproteobacteria bacterium]|nr:hypothetical protein [Gammaproteobacteria bacterium]